MGKLIALSREPFDVTIDDVDATFKCVPLTANQRAKVQDMIVVSMDGEDLSGAIGSRFLYAVRYGLTEIVPPMEDAAGNPIQPKRLGGGLADDYLDLIPDHVIVSVGTKIINASALSPKQVGE